MKTTLRSIVTIYLCTTAMITVSEQVEYEGDEAQALQEDIALL